TGQGVFSVGGQARKVRGFRSRRVPTPARGGCKKNLNPTAPVGRYIPANMRRRAAPPAGHLARRDGRGDCACPHSYFLVLCRGPVTGTSVAPVAGSAPSTLREGPV